MPPRWPRQPDRQDPAYRKLEDRINFAVHVALFAASNSGVWFFRFLGSQDWAWAPWLTGAWGVVLFGHALWLFALARYTPVEPPVSSSSQPE